MAAHVGLVLLLPHGYEGQGPEHSSARLERYLQLCAERNMTVANLTTPANYFHALRRQLKRNFRKPLVVIMTPKSAAAAQAGGVGAGGLHRRQPLPPRDPGDRRDWPPAEAVKRVVLCTGKVYYDLLAERREKGVQDVAIVRLEQIYPFPAKSLERSLLRTYPNAGVVWCQEEPENMGAWSFVDRKIERTLVTIGHRCARPDYVGRDAAASPATGLAKVHAAQQANLVARALALD